MIGDREVGAVGLGTASMSIPDDRDDALSVRTIHAAIDNGITLIDTAHAYTTLDEPSHAERLVRVALATRSGRDRILVATKGGHWRAGHAAFPIDGRPKTLRAHLDQSLRTLGVDVIDLYQLHHPDPRVPIEESVGALAEFRAAGLIRMIGVSNVDREQVDRALTATAIDSVQNHLSPFRTDDLPLIPMLEERGITYLSHSPFGGSLTSGRLSNTLPETAQIAVELGCSLHRLILAWHLNLSDAVIPVVGARRPSSIIDSSAAADLELSDAMMLALTHEFRVAGADAHA